MKNIKRIMALICALGLVSITAGCGNKKDSGENESAAETVTAEVTTAVTEEETEESETETEESETEKSETEESQDEGDSDAEDDNSASDIDFDMEGSLGSLNYKYNSKWIEKVVGDQITYTMNDLSGAIVIQKHDADSLGSLSEETTIQVLAEQSETVWESFDNMELLSSEWAEGVIDGKKCYAVKYSYTISSIDTTNTTYFFANFTDDSKELFAVTASSFNDATDVAAIAEEILSDISFS